MVCGGVDVLAPQAFTAIRVTVNEPGPTSPLAERVVVWNVPVNDPVTLIV
jgi:hypothetical protein